VGVTHSDTKQDAEYLAKKVAGMRIFNDDEGKMNLALKDVQGQVLSISQFSLHANPHKGNRPSFIRAARPEQAVPLYELFLKRLAEVSGREVQSGEFGAMMAVELLNDGPVTICMDTKNKE
jgi:D-tyrosyl-tRNA(Tyr) deacylase